MKLVRLAAPVLPIIAFVTTAGCSPGGPSGAAESVPALRAAQAQTHRPAPARSGAKPALGKSTRVETGQIGQTCTQSGGELAGSCGNGQVCLPFPGGYCTALCGGGDPCKTGSTCVESGAAGELCEKTCSRDDDCRTGEGYVCDPVWKACTIAGFLTPKAPECRGKALAKKTFGPARPLSSARGPGAHHLEPAATLGENGALTAVYVANRTFARNSLGVATLKPDGSVEADHELKSDRENHFDPWTAADRAGKLYAVWLAFDGGHAPEKRMQIAFSSSGDGKQWSTPVAVNDVGTDCPGDTPGCIDKPMIAIGPDEKDPTKDAIYVFYYSAPAAALKMVRVSAVGKVLGPSVVVGGDSYGDVEIDELGDLHVTYVTGTPMQGGYGSSAHHIEYTRSSDGGLTFSKPMTVSAPGESIPYYFVNPQVVADAKRKVRYVVYAAGTPEGKWDIVLATARFGSQSWSRIKVNDDSPCANHMLPTAALDTKTGNVHVMWTENRTGSGGVAYAMCDRMGSHCGSNEAVSDTPFAAYSLSQHTSKWLGGYSSLLFDSKRGILHTLWTQPVIEAGKTTTRIYHASAKLPTQGVVATR